MRQGLNAGMRTDAKEHLSMLYTPRKGQSDQEPLQEDALQAYFYCRLKDLLAGSPPPDAPGLAPNN